jgi:uncharacterized membrane protein HdeD (DUF308 family)
MSISKSLLWRGLLAIAIGVVSVIWPNITVGALVILFAVYAFIAAGLVALLWPNFTAVALTVWVGAWAVVTGIVEVALTFRPGETAGERTMWLLGGLVSIALGVVLFIRPDIGAVSLATIFGLFSLFSGVTALVLSAQARQAGATAQRLADSAA